MFECDIAHRRSVAVLCMLYKIRCNPLHPLNGALPRPYVPVPVTRGALVAHRYTYTPTPRSRTSQYHRTFILLPVSLGTILLTQYSMVWDWRVSRARPMLFYFPQRESIPILQCPTIFPFLFLLPIGWYCGTVVFGLKGCISLSLNLSLPTSFNNDDNNNNNNSF